jgi:hypothetical protein
MNNDFESKEWADNHLVLSDGIARLFSSIASGFISLRDFALSARSAGEKNPGGESSSTCDQTIPKSESR